MRGVRDDEPPRPDTIIVRRAQDQALINAVERLSERDREILMLSAWDELSGPEIAEVLGISLTTAQQRLHRAKKRLARVVNRTQPSLVLDTPGEEGADDQR